MPEYHFVAPLSLSNIVKNINYLNFNFIPFSFANVVETVLKFFEIIDKASIELRET